MDKQGPHKGAAAGPRRCKSLPLEPGSRRPHQFQVVGSYRHANLTSPPPHPIRRKNTEDSGLYLQAQPAAPSAPAQPRRRGWGPLRGAGRDTRQSTPRVHQLDRGQSLDNLDGKAGPVGCYAPGCTLCEDHLYHLGARGTGTPQEQRLGQVGLSQPCSAWRLPALPFSSNSAAGRCGCEQLLSGGLGGSAEPDSKVSASTFPAGSAPRRPRSAPARSAVPPPSLQRLKSTIWDPRAGLPS